MFDLRGKDLSKLTEKQIKQVVISKPIFCSSATYDRVALQLGNDWYSRIDVSKLRNVLIGERVYFSKTNEFGTVYKVDVELDAIPFPCLLVGFNIENENGSRIVEFVDLKFEDKVIARLNS